MIKRYVLTFMVLSLTFILFAEETEKIVIFQFKAIKVDKDTADALTETFITSMADFSKYQMIERTQLDQIFNELKLAASDDFSDSTVLQIGKLAKAKLALVGNVTKLGNKFIINARVIEVETGKIIFGKNISCETENDLFDSAKKLAELVCDPKRTDKLLPESDPPKDVNRIKIPKYIFTDPFDQLDTTFWKTSKSEEITLKAVNHTLQFSGKYREGRLNSINSITSGEFKVSSFAIEISFRDPLKSSNYVSLLIGNVDWLRGNSLRLSVNMEKENYKFYWTRNSDWQSHNDNILDLFGDENTQFHKLKIVYDLENKTGYGFVDDQLIDKITDFSFLRTDKLQITITMGESVSNTKKDVQVELSNFNSSVNLK